VPTPCFQIQDLKIWSSTQRSTPPKINMGVSKNNGIPKSSTLIGFSIINHPFCGTPIFGNTHMEPQKEPFQKRGSSLPTIIFAGLMLVFLGEYQLCPWTPTNCRNKETRQRDLKSTEKWNQETSKAVLWSDSLDWFLKWRQRLTPCETLLLIILL